MTMAQANADSLNLRQRLSRFFYAEEVPFGLAIIRILMPLVLLVPMLPRWPVARELFSSDGAAAPLWVNYGNLSLLPVLPGTVIVALHTALIFCLIASSIGWRTRISLAGATILFTYINMCDSVSTITKYSVIASHVLLLLTLSNCGGIWSVDAWLKRRRNPRKGGTPPGLRVDLPKFHSWPRRLMQLFIGIVYFGSAVTKMHTPEYFNGEQLQTWLLSNVNYQNPVGEFLAVYPAMLVLSGYIGIVWEVLFVFLGWKGWGRISMIGLGIVFHLMTTLMLGLYIFPAVCLAAYFAFLEERDVRKLSLLFRRWRKKIGWSRRSRQPVPASAAGLRVPPALKFPEPALYGFVILATVVAGMELEHQLDPYGIRRPEGPYTLKEIDPALVQRMIAPTQPLRVQDMFDTFHIGTKLVGGLLFDHTQEFRQGEIAVVQVGMNTPHHDMWVECNLHDANNNIIDLVGQVVSREMYRANFYYNLTSALEAGEYDLVLKSAGQEITRRRITLTPDTVRPVAN